MVSFVHNGDQVYTGTGLETVPGGLTCAILLYYCCLLLIDNFIDLARTKDKTYHDMIVGEMKD
jgi:hypothetical protein